MSIIIKDITDPEIFLAIKRMCKYLVDEAWHTTADFEYDHAVNRSRQYSDQIEILSDLDLDLGWGDKKIQSTPGSWSIKHVGNFNPWFDDTLNLEELLESLEPLAEILDNTSPKQTGELEFLHYYGFLRKSIPRTNSSIPVVISLQSLHPKIQEHSTSLFLDGHFSDAILAACKVVFTELKLISKLDLEEFDLASRVMSLDNPIIKLNPLITKTDKNEQKGFMLLLQGLASGVRAPKAHDLIIQNDEHKALSYLAFASLLMQRIDERLAPRFQQSDGTRDTTV